MILIFFLFSGISDFDFLRINPSARCGVFGSGAGVLDEFFNSNASKIVFKKGFGATISQGSYFEGITDTSFDLYYSKKFGIGVSYRSFGITDTEVDFDGNIKGDITNKSGYLATDFAYRIKNTSFSFGFKTITSNINSSRASFEAGGLLFDLGSFYMRDITTFGFAVRNIGSANGSVNISGNTSSVNITPPLEFDISGSFNIRDVLFGYSAVFFESSYRLAAGVEIPVKFLFLRLGADYQKLLYPVSGFGVYYRNLRFDYQFKMLEFTSYSIFSLSFHFIP